PQRAKGAGTDDQDDRVPCPLLLNLGTGLRRPEFQVFRQVARAGQGCRNERAMCHGTWGAVRLYLAPYGLYFVGHVITSFVLANVSIRYVPHCDPHHAVPSRYVP